MTTTKVYSERLKESYERIEHKSGLTIMLYPMKEFKTTYALFTAGVGSINNAFTLEGETFHVPDGIAHFLEHKLFESEEGDAFELYSKIGVSANAYTSFDKTAYLFSCTENFDKALEILISLVTHPYFTPQTVKKEQGIIGQEIKMYEDDPGWRVYFNLLGSLYHNNPIKLDIAGTVASISEITDKTLYSCHKAFYNLKNMVLTVAGNFESEEVLAICDRLLKYDSSEKITIPHVDEPLEIVKPYSYEKLSVAEPLFQLGFKGRDSGLPQNILAQTTGEILSEIISGEASPLYRRLYDEGLINNSFDSEIMAGPSYLVTMFSGESENPKKVAEMLLEEIKKLQENGIPLEDFVRAKKCCYGRYVDIFESVESVASVLAQCHLAQCEAYGLLDNLANLELKDAEAYLKENMDITKSALSVIGHEEC